MWSCGYRKNSKVRFLEFNSFMHEYVFDTCTHNYYSNWLNFSNPGYKIVIVMV